MEGKKLQNRVAIVTGSTSGIGLGIARCLAKQGCSLTLNGSRSEKDAQDLVAEFQKEYGIKAIYVQADLSKPSEAATSIIEATKKAFGTIHILVNNAGIQFVSKVEDFPPEQWDHLINVNLSTRNIHFPFNFKDSAFHTIRLSIPIMKQNSDKWGRIINISSVHGIVASVNKSAYVASKHGLNGLTKVVALENAADTNITCNVICPGWVHTPLISKQIENRATQKNLTIEQATADLLGEKQPSKKFTTPEAIGEMVVLLCSEAGSNITGSEQIMDGGWTTQ